MNHRNPALTLLAVTAMILSQPFTHTATGQQARITVHARETLHTVSPYMTGACIEDVNHEIYGGLYSQMVYGESFQEPAPPATSAGFHANGGDRNGQSDEVQVSGMWRPVQSGSARGRFS